MTRIALAAHFAVVSAIAAATLSCTPGSVIGDDRHGGGSGGGMGGQGGDPGGGGPGGGAGGGPGGGPGGGGADCSAGSLDAAGCSCPAAGATRACGSAVGACKKGEQVCLAGSGTVSGAKWGPCAGGAKPGAEMCGDGVDNDCNGKSDCADPACDSFCKGRDAGAPDGPVSAPPACKDTPCTVDQVQICDSYSCDGPNLRVCLSDGTWGGCAGGHICVTEKGGCKSHLECKRHELCIADIYHPDGGASWVSRCQGGKDVFNTDIDVVCDTDADCAKHRVCTSAGSCRCHPHGFCVKDCLVGSECPAGKFCDIHLGFTFGVCQTIPKDFAPTGCPKGATPEKCEY